MLRPLKSLKTNLNQIKILMMIKHIKFLLLIASILISNYIFPQAAAFEISIEPTTISGLGGLHSYAFGQHQGKWLLVGGRLDGLHQRQPWAQLRELEDDSI